MKPFSNVSFPVGKAATSQLHQPHFSMQYSFSLSLACFTEEEVNYYCLRSCCISINPVQNTPHGLISLSRSLSVCLIHTPSLQAARFSSSKLLPNGLNTLHITQNNIQDKSFPSFPCFLNRIKISLLPQFGTASLYQPIPEDLPLLIAQTLKHTEWVLSCCTGGFHSGVAEDTNFLRCDAVCR